ncbi:cupin domain-containing protein [Egibacter rhizosphaerae]|uniref:Cupin domain-containing protein n=1 Tax=Egibacter rhizosphaerae TaxID=1670831 RepID=A0A411YJF6_9ACTN|nr:cupin domain-containing protein [Egibacter rhizosphaerae]QBI21370.1 cupin domain-containing protein [Egibacter rhizosphaerae]
MESLTGHQVAALLDLEPLPVEGGLYRRIHADEACTSIYYLMIAPAYSALHALTVTEVWHHHAGAPARMLLLHPDGHVERPVLGPELVDGQRSQVVVPPGTWQGAATLGDWTLAGCTAAPAFTDAAFTLGAAEDLAAAYPGAAEDVRRLAGGGA